MTRSIRRNLLLLLLSAITLAWASVSFWVYHDAQHEIEEIYDANLVQTAKLLLVLVRHELSEESNETLLMSDMAEASHKYEAKITFAIYHPQGALDFKAPNSPKFSKSSQQPGFSNEFIDGFSWRIFTLKDADSSSLVQTAHRSDVRQELVERITQRLAILMLISLPPIALLIWVSVGQGLKPLIKVAHEIASRSPEQLQPVATNTTPTEVQPLIKALNALFERLQHAFDNERRFTADAAHELRTPLAGIKTQAQVAARATDAQQQQHALEQITTGTTRMTHLVEQLLTMARVDATQSMPMANVDLRQLCAEVITELSPTAVEKGIDISLANENAWAISDKNSLILLLRNLIGNAIKYTENGGKIIITAHMVGDNAVLSVADNGPGIPATLRAQMFERFQRGAENSNGSGSGLGLSIVQRVAELHSATIDLDSGLDDRGLSVNVTLHNNPA
ncbi:MAG: hypothetical protein GXP10_00465 [Gammaproteobacteria bacterium]|nr:hypothetical protein [Gammaproteobacteria bacterium]